MKDLTEQEKAEVLGHVETCFGEGTCEYTAEEENVRKPEDENLFFKRELEKEYRCTEGMIETHKESSNLFREEIKKLTAKLGIAKLTQETNLNCIKNQKKEIERLKKELDRSSETMLESNDLLREKIKRWKQGCEKTEKELGEQLKENEKLRLENIKLTGPNKSTDQLYEKIKNLGLDKIRLNLALRKAERCDEETMAEMKAIELLKKIILWLEKQTEA